MEDKMGMPLDEIHISGRVPQCELDRSILGFDPVCIGEIDSIVSYVTLVSEYTLTVHILRHI